MDWNRFYPIFPAPLPSIGIDAINVDITHSALFRLAETGADIVILPSLLKAFTKVSPPLSSALTVTDDAYRSSTRH